MSARSRRYCPVCWQPAGKPTSSGLIAAHFDSVGRDVCPASGQPFTIAGYGRRRRVIEREYHAPVEVESEGTAVDCVGSIRMDRLEGLLTA